MSSIVAPVGKGTRLASLQDRCTHAHCLSSPPSSSTFCSAASIALSLSGRTAFHTGTNDRNPFWIAGPEDGPSTSSVCRIREENPLISTQTFPCSSHRSTSSLTTSSPAWLPAAYRTHATISRLQGDTIRNLSSANGKRVSCSPPANIAAPCSALSSKLGCST